MEKVYLSDSDYQEYLTSMNFIGSGYESFVFSLGNEVVKILNKEIISDDLEMRIDALGDIKELNKALSIPTKSLYLNMDFIGFYMKYAGIDLKRYLIENDVSFDELVRILKDIKEKLVFLHQYGIVHGDIQLKNIMIHDGRIKIGDSDNIKFGTYNDVLLNDMTLYLSKYFGITHLLDLYSLNYITYILLNTTRSEELEYLSMDALGYSYMLESKITNQVFQDDIFEEQMNFLRYPKENKEYALEKSKYLIDYLK